MKTNAENRGCDFNETFSKARRQKFFIHHINKDRSLFHVLVISPSLFEPQSIRRLPGSMRHQWGGSMCGCVVRHSGID